jgi:hypothetical protein
MSADNSWWCHAFLRFLFDDGRCRIFESKISTKGFAETDPSYYDLEALAEAGKETAVEAVAMVPICRAYDVHRMPGVSVSWTDRASIQTALELCEQWCGAKSYPIGQLAAIWLAKRYGCRVPMSDQKLICSEALAVIAFQLGVELRDKWHPNFDSVTPGSAWNNLMAIRAGYGDSIISFKKEAGICGSGFSKYYSLRPSRP